MVPLPQLIDNKHLSKSKIKSPGQKLIHESILGTKFEGKVVSEGPFIGSPFNVQSIVPQISGQAFITGFNKVNIVFNYFNKHDK